MAKTAIVSGRSGPTNVRGGYPPYLPVSGWSGPMAKTAIVSGRSGPTNVRGGGPPYPLMSGRSGPTLSAGGINLTNR
jgi:hypothetical protein